MKELTAMNSIKTTRDHDLAFSREIYLSLIAKNMEAIETMMGVAQDTESPRASEVLGNLIKSAADITDKIALLYKADKDLSLEKENKNGGSINNTTNNNIAFVGTTSEFQRMLKETLNPSPSYEKVIKDYDENDIPGLRVEDIQIENELIEINTITQQNNITEDNTK